MDNERAAMMGDNDLELLPRVRQPRQLREWHYEILGKKAVKALERHGMKAWYARSCEEALGKVLNLIPQDATIGRGDSLTLHEVGITSALSEGDYDFVDPWSDECRDLGMTERVEIWRSFLYCDVFLTGANAITIEGELVNVDAVGNRVAPLLFGPPRVIVVAGANKLVRDAEAGLRRIQNVAAPLNAKRHGRRLPCAETGVCSDCTSQDRMCRQVVTVKRDSGSALYGEPRIHVVLVGKELGL